MDTISYIQSKIPYNIYQEISLQNFAGNLKRSFQIHNRFLHICVLCNYVVFNIQTVSINYDSKNYFLSLLLLQKQIFRMALRNEKDDTRMISTLLRHSDVVCSRINSSIMSKCYILSAESEIMKSIVPKLKSSSILKICIYFNMRVSNISELNT